MRSYCTNYSSDSCSKTKVQYSVIIVITATPHRMNYSDSSRQDTSFSRDYKVCCLKLRVPKYVITSPHDKVLQHEFNYSDIWQSENIYR